VNIERAARGGGVLALAIFFVALVVSAGAISAFASPGDGPYIRLEGGATMPMKVLASGSSGLNFSFKPSVGEIGGAAFGWRLAPVRLEIDADWSHAGVSSIHYGNDAGLGAVVGKPSFSGTTVPVSGSIQNVPVMLNGYFDLVNHTRFEPYVGVGVGFSTVRLHDITANNAMRLINSSAKTTFAFQPIVGANLQVSDHVSVGLQYRYFRSLDPQFTDRAGHRFTINNSAHNVLASLTYHFAAPSVPPAATPVAVAVAAPAPPAPPAAPAVVARPAPRVFLIFFAFDSARLSATGRQAADAAIASYRQDPSNMIVVRGFTDLTGSNRYDLALSKQRAMTVYNYLTAHGVPATEMGVDWLGKAYPRVATDKAEQQNRRVEIEM
jgi:outer membrane protein OmpA-like peptidoglycan-associated protein